MNQTKKLATVAILVAIGVVCSPFSIPLGIAKCFPVQHMLNVIIGVLFGPLYAVLAAFCTSLIRVLMGTGTLLAFPGSMVGALLCGLMYKYVKNIPLAMLAEIFGTGILGALIAYPVAKFVLGNDTAAIFTYVIPFLVSTVVGAALSAIILSAIKVEKLQKLIQ